MDYTGDYKKILVTGGLGFIGSSYIRIMLSETDLEIVNLDLMTYAANPRKRSATSRMTRATPLSKVISPTPEVVETSRERLRRSSQLRRRNTRRPLHPRRRTFYAHECGGGACAPGSCQRARGIRFVQDSTDEVYGEVMEGLERRRRPLQTAQPV